MVENIEAALQKGPYPSVDTDDAIKDPHEETREKVDKGYAKLIRYGYLKKNLLEKLTIYLVTMIPQKLCSHPNDTRPIIRAATQGYNDAISKINDCKSRATGINYPYTAVCAAPYRYTDGQLKRLSTFKICKTGHQG